MKDPFEQATRQKLRFPTARGALGAEQLWDVPLRSKDAFNLDEVARAVSRELKEASQESFVDGADPAQTKAQGQRALRLEVVKRVIEVLLEEERRAQRAAAASQERAKLLQILSEKQDGRLSALSEEELRRRISELA